MAPFISKEQSQRMENNKAKAIELKRVKQRMEENRRQAIEIRRLKSQNSNQIFSVPTYRSTPLKVLNSNVLRINASCPQNHVSTVKWSSNVII